MDKILNIIFDKEESRIKFYLKLVVYLSACLFFLYKVNFYTDKVGRFPDEVVHVSYVAYLEQEDKVIPNFKDMRILEGVDVEKKGSQDCKFSETSINYLGHPPLYYNILRIFSGIETEGDTVTVNVGRLRVISQAIVFIGLLIAAYIGFTRISRLILNFLYSVIIVSVPMLAYSSAGVSNDALCFVGINVLLLGFIRVLEDKRDKKTYFIVGIGYFILLLTKLTAGLVGVLAGVMIIAYICIKEKSIKILFNKNFAMTLPLYILCALYYLYTMKTYGSVNPSLSVIAPEYYKTTGFYIPEDKRVLMNFAQYKQYYWTNFIKSWTGISSHVALLKEGIILTKDTIGIALILIFPLISILPISKNKTKKAAMAVYLGIVFCILYQFYTVYNGYKNVNGYPGGFQSRYYLCGIAAMGLLIVTFFEDLYELFQSAIKNKNVLNIIKVAFCIFFICFGILLIKEDFVYFINHFTSYIR